MQVFTNIYDWNPPQAGCAIALGRFDGVHLGHRALLTRAVEHASRHNLIPACFSFQEQTFPGVETRGELTTADEKAALLEKIGIQVLLHPEFRSPLISMTAEEFLSKLLIQRWKAKLIIAGYDFHFGRERRGDANFLLQEGLRLGAEVDIFQPFDIGGLPVKATNIRNLIREGKIEEANSLLGRPYSVYVISMPGLKLGRNLGFPTINFDWPQLKIKPKYGIYAVKIESAVFCKFPALNRKTVLHGVANFGVRPTIEPENKSPQLEVHILENMSNTEEVQDSLSENVLFHVELMAFIRDEKRFGSRDELKKQIARDVEHAKTYFDLP